MSGSCDTWMIRILDIEEIFGDTMDYVSSTNHL